MIKTDGVSALGTQKYYLYNKQNVSPICVLFGEQLVVKWHFSRF